MGIQDEELEGLSDEERAALEDDDDESEILGKIAGDNAGDSGDEDDDGEDDGEDAGATAGNQSADAGAAADAEGADDAAGEPASAAVSDEFRPEFKAAAPEGLAERLTALDQQESAIEKAFDDGEIDRDEMRKQLKAVASERTDLKIAESQAKWAEDQNADTRAQRWQWEQERFFVQEKAAIYKDPIILAALDASVKQLAADPVNAKKPAAFFLDEADRQVRKRFNMGDAPLKTIKTGDRQPDLSKVPKTLAQLPAAEMAETGSEEFAYLDKLDGIALETALRKLSPEQEARYLGGAA